MTAKAERLLKVKRQITELKFRARTVEDQAFQAVRQLEALEAEIVELAAEGERDG